MSVNYPKGSAHRYCEPHEMLDFKYFENFEETQDVREYVYETLGFVSTGTRFHTALNFGCSGMYTKCDTIFVMRLPAGTKFIMPITKSSLPNGKIHYSDYEYEFVLFPLHNTFVVQQADKVNYKSSEGTFTINVYYGSYCNELNVHRPPNMPKMRKLKKLPSKSYIQVDIKALNQKPSGKCSQEQIDACEGLGKICNPASGKCLLPSAANIKKVGLKKTTGKKTSKAKAKGKTIGKCTAQKREQCKSTGKICNPKSGQCLQNTAANQTKAAAAAKDYGIKTTTTFAKHFL